MAIAFLTLERNVTRVAYEIKHEKAKEVGASLTLQKLVKSICLHVLQLFKDFEEWGIVIARP